MSGSGYLSNEVALIQRDLDAAVRDNERLRSRVAVLEREREMLRGELRLSRTERDEHMLMSANLMVILDATATSLVQGINQAKSNDKLRKAAHVQNDAARYLKEHTLDDGLPEHRPAFLDRKSVPPAGEDQAAPPADPAPAPPRRELPAVPKLRGELNRPPAYSGGPINHHDARLGPPIEFTADEEHAELRRLANAGRG